MGIAQSSCGSCANAMRLAHPLSQRSTSTSACQFHESSQPSSFNAARNPTLLQQLPSQQPPEKDDTKYSATSTSQVREPQNEGAYGEYRYTMAELLEMASQEEQQHEQNVQQFQQEHTHPQSIVAKHRANPTEQLAAPASEQTSEERQQQPQQFNLPQDAHPHGAIHQHPAPQRHANMPTEPMPLNATGSGHWAAAPPKCPLMTKLSTSSASRFQELPNTVALAPGVERIDPEVVRELLRNRECVLIDVRGDDRSSGTIEGATHVPAIGPVPFTARIPEHVQLWQSQQLVIFHCQYSAHRNPPVRELVSGAGC
jgi:anaerobic selenocysteine-containing dehydrogenase